MTTLPNPSTARRAVLAAFVGSVIDWYDFFLYGTAAALVFGKIFFPTFSAGAGTIAAFGTFAAGFLVRPIGGLIFGYLGDRYGRKVSLIWTLFIMGFATFLVGCLPTYDTWGLVAPLLLIILRCLQGMAVGGEWGGAALISVEHSRQERRGLNGSWTQSGMSWGLLLGIIVFRFALWLSGEDFLVWGWRIPFLLGIVLLAVGFYIRVYVAETPAFEESKAHEVPTPNNPIITALRREWTSILIVAGARLAENASFYIYTVFVLSYGTQVLDLDRETLLNGLILGACVQILSIPLFGYCSDIVGRRAVYLFGLIVFLLTIFPYFWLLESKSPTLIALAGVFSLGIAHAAMYAPQAAFFAELFPVRVRYSGASLGYQLASPLAGGLSPIIATGLLLYGDNRPLWVGVYMCLLGLISMTAIIASAETRQRDITR